MNPWYFISKTEQKKKSVYFSTKVSLKPKKVATYLFHSNKRCQLSEFMIKSLFYIFPAAPQNLLLSVIQQLSNIRLLKVCYSQDCFLFIAGRITMVLDTMKVRLSLFPIKIETKQEAELQRRHKHKLLTQSQFQRQYLNLSAIQNTETNSFYSLSRLINLQIHRLRAVTSSLSIPHGKPTSLIPLLLAENVGTCTCHQYFPLQTLLS